MTYRNFAPLLPAELWGSSSCGAPFGTHFKVVHSKRKCLDKGKVVLGEGFIPRGVQPTRARRSAPEGPPASPPWVSLLLHSMK
jgi:hypothetical protein